VLKSTDDGETWIEIGRQPSPFDATFAWTSLPDGRVIRGMCNSYHAFDPDEPVVFWTETSTDGGNTWTRGTEIAEGHSGSGSHPHRLKRLADGTLALLITHEAPFGPGRQRVGRNAKRPYLRQENTAFLFLSKDQARTWTGPLTIFPGFLTYEPDFVELPSGDLLFLNSTVQGGPPIRQYVRKTRFGYVPEPVYDVVAGTVPECPVSTTKGLLVGAVRGGGYSCSNDEGATWHAIEGLPACGYQPSMVERADGRILCAWHGGGGDEPFGQKHLFVGTTTFRLEANLPAPTRLDLVRDQDDAGYRFINRYILTLRAGDQPLTGKTLRYSFLKRYEKDPVEGTAVTNAQGQAQIDLTEVFKEVTDIHLSYHLEARFEPEPKDKSLAPCQSVRYMAYAITTSRKDLGWT